MFQRPSRDKRRACTNRLPKVRYPTEHQTSSAEIIEIFWVCREVRWPVVEYAAQILQGLVQRALAGRRLLPSFGRRLLLFLQYEPEPLFDQILELATTQGGLGFGAAEHLVRNVDGGSHASASNHIDAKKQSAKLPSR